MSEREAFEAWARAHCYTTQRISSRPNARYDEYGTASAWAAWQAASAGKAELLDCLFRYAAQDELRGPDLTSSNLYRTAAALLEKHGAKQ